MNDVFFSESFYFNNLSFKNYKYTDNRRGSHCHFFALMLEGTSKIVTQNYCVEVAPGDIFYIPKKVGYQSYWYGNPDIKFISLGFLYLPNFGQKLYPSQVIEKSDDALNLFYEISAAEELDAPLVGKFYTLCGILLPKMASEKQSRSAEITETVKKEIAAHPQEKMAQIAKRCAMSEAAVYAAFKKAGNSTPNDERNKMLVEKAKDMLISTDESVENVSDALGFSSPSYFRKKFKAYFNLTPTELRKKYRI